MKIKRILAVLLLLPTLLIAQQITIPDGWTDAYTYANGIRLHYYRAAAQPGKPVLIMVHGVTDNGLCWTSLTQKFQDRFDIYMLDTRGHGLSDPFTSGDDGGTLVKDVVEFVKAMKFEKPILMGHSMGAATVMRLGAEYPEVARAIIMLDPLLGPRTSRPPAAAKKESDKDKQGETVKTVPPRGTPNNRLSVNMFGTPETLVAQNNYHLDDLIATGLRQFPLWSKTDVEYWALSKKQYHGPYSSEASQAMTGTMNIGNSLARIQVPAIVLKADASPEIRKANEEAAAVMKKGKLVHIDGAGHNLHHDKPEQSAQIINDFLSKL